jgi:WD40 repeat protein
VFRPDGRVLATADFSGRTYLWDVATRVLAAILNDPDSQGVEAVAFSPDGKTLATADQNGRTYLWDVPRGS